MLSLNGSMHSRCRLTYHELAEEDVQFGLPVWVRRRAEVLAEQFDALTIWLANKLEDTVELFDVVQYRGLYQSAECLIVHADVSRTPLIAQ